MPYERGGFEIPNFRIYYLVAQCSFSRHWFHFDSQVPYLRSEADLSHPTPLSALMPVGKPVSLKHDPLDLQTLSTTSWAWKQLARATRAQLLYSSALPLAGNLWVPVTQEVTVQRTLSKFNLAAFGDVFPSGHVFSCVEDAQFR